MALAIKQIHYKGLTHRDISVSQLVSHAQLSNILQSDDGSFKLCDYSLTSPLNFQ